MQVVRTNLQRGQMRRQSQHGGGAPAGIIQAVYQVHITRAGAAAADGKLTAELRLCAGGKGGGFLMAHMHPADA